MSSSKVLFMMSGSIAAFKACEVVSRLARNGNEVQVVATPSTFQFIGSATLEGLSGRAPLSDLWERGRAMDHIHLTRWADFAILCPASANTIARLSQGLGDDLIAAMALAWPTEKPFWIFPAMNSQMLASVATQENLDRLALRGFRVAPTQDGSLACGEEGPGRLLEAEDILRLVTAPPRGRVLVTAGATREPIDGIRFVSNVSTGQTGADLADRLTLAGWSVTYLHGAGARQPRSAANRVEFSTFSDLDRRLREELASQHYDAVIHCAAVGDFSPENPATDRKLDGHTEWTLKMKPNFKILPRLKEYSRNKAIAVVGFKLTLNKTDSETAEIARGLLGDAVDAVVANEWSTVRADRARHPGRLIARDSERAFETVAELGTILNDWIGRLI